MRCAVTHTPHPNFTIRLAVCKIQRQLNEKHIVSQEKLEGGRGHHASLGRASEPIGAWGRRPAAPLPSPPPASWLPSLQQGPQALPSLLGGGVIWEPDVELQPLEGRGAEGERGRVAFGIQQMETLECGLCHLHSNLEVLDKLLNLSGHHPHALRFPEKYGRARRPVLCVGSTPHGYGMP